jgi:hypothetical protein
LIDQRRRITSIDRWRGWSWNWLKRLKERFIDNRFYQKHHRAICAIIRHTHTTGFAQGAGKRLSQLCILQEIVSILLAGLLRAQDAHGHFFAMLMIKGVEGYCGAIFAE